MTIEEIPTGKMPKPMLDAFLNEVHLARIATVDPATLQPHVVPVWYGWDGSSIWISSYSTTRKISEIKANPRISIAIDTPSVNGKMRAVVMEGSAELITEPRTLIYEKSEWVYTRYLGVEGVKAADPQEWIHDPQNLLIRLRPSKIYSWYEGE